MMDRKTLHARGVSCNLAGIILSNPADRTTVHLEELTAEDTTDTPMLLLSWVFISALKSNHTNNRHLFPIQKYPAEAVCSLPTNI